VAYSDRPIFKRKGLRVEISVSSRNTDVSEALRLAVTDKIGRLNRFVEGMDRAEVHFWKEGNPRQEFLEVTLEGHGHHVRSKVSAADGFVCVDKAVDKLEHQLHKLKTKVSRRNGHIRARVEAAANGVGPGENGAGATATSTDLLEASEEDAEVRIVKVKRFEMKPMTAEEAAMQMDLVGHTFFFFTNVDTERAAVVYRRDDGQVGLIEQA
jgi:putative sigma-54 modulation protein